MAPEDWAMSDGEAAEEMRAASVSLAHATVSNDAARIAGLLAPAWRLVDADGVTSRAASLDVVLARVVNTAHFGGEVFEADEWTTDVFVRSEDSWRCVHSHVTAARPG